MFGRIFGSFESLESWFHRQSNTNQTVGSRELLCSNRLTVVHLPAVRAKSITHFGKETQMSQYPGTPYTPPYQPVEAPKPSGLAVASMVLGIISLVLFCVWYLSIPCAIIG